MKNPSRWVACLAAGLVLACVGCASIVKLETPDEFKKKKMKEDPPISLLRPASMPQEGKG